METNETVPTPGSGISNLCSEIAKPALNYAPPRRFARVRRWMGPGSAGFVGLVLILAIAGSWGAWEWRLRADARAFEERTTAGPLAGWIMFTRPPNAASIRHLSRLPSGLDIAFSGADGSDLSAPEMLRGRQLRNIRGFWFRDGMNVDAWLKEIVRPDSGLTALSALYLFDTKLTDAGLMELARPDSGLKCLASLRIDGTQVTDVGVKSLARPDGGLKGLVWLDLSRTRVTDAGVRELARGDSGLRALAILDLQGTGLTDAGVKELARPDTGVKLLTIVNLSDTKVTDAGLMELARPDSGLRTLGKVTLWNARVTPAGIAALQKARRGLKIEGR